MCSYAVARSTDELNGCADEDTVDTMRLPNTKETTVPKRSAGYPKLAPHIRIGGVTLKATDGYGKAAPLKV